MNSSFNPAVPYLHEDHPRVFPWLNVALFLLTCASTLVVGSLLMADFNGAPLTGFWHPSRLLTGLPFSLAIMSILFSHEMGHYLACRYYRIDATLPYFIPFPNPVGTMGAFIKIRAPINNRGALLDVGIAGPIAGFVVAVIALLLSIGHGRFVPAQDEGQLILLGEPLILKVVEYFAGVATPEGMDMYMHPVAFAAWFGFLATALNLLPAAQLDGGHVVYAIFRGYHKKISFAVLAVLIPLAMFYWPGWWVWIVLLLVLRLYHPPTLDDSLPLQPRHFVLGVIGLLLLVLCFTPAPFVL